MIKNVFFDLDGTIIDSSHGIYEGILLSLEKYGYELPDESILKKCVGPPFSYSFPKYFNVTDDDFPKLLHTYREFYEKDGFMKCKLYDGIEDLLSSLYEKGYLINICSSKPGVTCKDILDHLGISKYFHDIVGSTKDGRVDTKEEVIELCFEQSPFMKREETILIGDTKFDALGAQKSGIRCICISWGFGERVEMLEAGAIDVFESGKEVLKYIEEN